MPLAVHFVVFTLCVFVYKISPTSHLRRQLKSQSNRKRSTLMYTSSELRVQVLIGFSNKHRYTFMTILTENS